MPAALEAALESAHHDPGGVARVVAEGDATDQRLLHDGLLGGGEPHAGGLDLAGDPSHDRGEGVLVGLRPGNIDAAG